MTQVFSTTYRRKSTSEREICTREAEKIARSYLIELPKNLGLW